MNLNQLLENAIQQEHRIAQELTRLEQMRWGLRGQIDLLHQLIAQQQPQPTQAEYIEAPSG